MPETFFPAFLRLSGRSCLLIGGEGVAVEKGEALLAAGAVLTVVAPRLAAALGKHIESGRLTWYQETFQARHMDHMWCVVSTLEDPMENRRIHAEADRRHLFLNVVDQPEFCTFYWPATLHRPPVSVACSTGGKSPALSGYLRRRMESLLPENMGAFAEWLVMWRRHVSPRLPDLEARGRFWRTLFDQGMAERFLSGDEAGAELMIRHQLEQTTR